MNVKKTFFKTTAVSKRSPRVLGSIDQSVAFTIYSSLAGTTNSLHNYFFKIDFTRANKPIPLCS